MDDILIFKNGSIALELQKRRFVSFRKIQSECSMA